MSTEHALDSFFRIVELIIIPFLAYITNKITNLENKVDRVDRKVDKVETVLIGPDGKNGLRSRLRRLELEVRQLSLQQAARHGEAPTIVTPDENDS